MITAAEVDELVAALVEQTRTYLGKSLEGLSARLEALEDRVGVLALSPGLPGPPGPPGKDLEASAVLDLKAEIATVRARLEAVPVEPAAILANLASTVASKAIDGKDGAAGLNGKDGRDGIDGENGKDGVGLADAVIDRAGHLILTMTDGRTKDVGLVVGRDGDRGRDVDPVAVDKRLGEMVAAVLETWERPRDGRDGVDGKDGAAGASGKDGLDGLGFDDLEGLFDKAGRLVLRFRRGEKTVEIPVPCLTDQTVYKPGADYRKGDGVTFDRSFWICQVDHPKAGPSKSHQGGTKEWRLAVARGRDAKDLVAAELAALEQKRDDGFA